MILKDRLYDYLVKKNGRVWYEYERYVREHIEEHYMHRFKHIRLLLRLNYEFRVKKRGTPYLYWDTPMMPGSGDLSNHDNVSYDSELRNLISMNLAIDYDLKQPETYVEYVGGDMFISWYHFDDNQITLLYKFDNNIYKCVEATHTNYFRVRRENKGKYCIARYCNGKVSDYSVARLYETSEKETINPVIPTLIELDGQLVILWKELSKYLSVNVYVGKEGDNLELYKSVAGQGVTIDGLVNDSSYVVELRCLFDGIEINSTSLVGTPRLDQSSLGSCKKDTAPTEMVLTMKELNNRIKPSFMQKSVTAANPYPHVLSKSMLDYDIIVLDIFETTLFRPFFKASDLFFILEDRFSFLNFHSIRIECEKRARNKKKALLNNSEVTIQDIYREIQLETGINAEYGAMMELEVEKEFCRANPYILRLIDILKAMKKTIIFASDMYFSSSELSQILSNAGIKDFDAVYSSCDSSSNKRDGSLLKLIEHEWGDKRFYLIDDRLNNIHAAEKSGWGFFWYNCSVEGTDFPNEIKRDMSPLMASAYLGTVNFRLNVGIRDYSDFYKYGYLSGGLYIVGFCNWIKKKCQEENIEKVIFVSRDGAIYKEIFEKFHCGIDTDYLYWSRKVAARLAWDYNRSLFWNMTVESHKDKFSIEELFRFLSIERKIYLLEEYSLSKYSMISDSNSEIIKKLFVDYWDTIFEDSKKEQIIAGEYLKRIIDGKKRIALVDVGWKGANLLGIKWFIKSVCKAEIDVKLYLAAINSNQNLMFDMGRELEGYLFTGLKNVDICKKHKAGSFGLNNMFFELLSQDSAPSVTGFDYEDGFKICFDIPEPENEYLISEIKNGIRDFAEDYYSYFGKYSYMLDISGRDAYIPFHVFSSDFAYMVNSLKDYRFSREVISKDSNPSIVDTVKEILEKEGALR